MSDRRERPATAELVGDLARTLRELRRELRAERRSAGRGLDRLVRFTSEVTIPATILLLETNVRALQLIQRSLRLARDPDADLDRQEDDITAIGRTVVDRIDDALSQAGSAVEETDDGEVGDLLAEARELNRELEARLQDRSDAATDRAEVDVDAELASLKEDVDQDENGN